MHNVFLEDGTADATRRFDMLGVTGDTGKSKVMMQPRD
jgi:hypothetical protein